MLKSYLKLYTNYTELLIWPPDSILPVAYAYIPRVIFESFFFSYTHIQAMRKSLGNSFLIYPKFSNFSPLSLLPPWSKPPSYFTWNIEVGCNKISCNPSLTLTIFIDLYSYIILTINASTLNNINICTHLIYGCP